MSINEKWNKYKENTTNELDGKLKELLSEIDELKEKPSMEYYEAVRGKLEKLEPDMKKLPAQLYVEGDKVIKTQLSLIYDDILTDLFKEQNIKKKSRWEVFEEEARRKDWKPVIEIINEINEIDKSNVTDDMVEGIESKTNSIKSYLLSELSPYECEWARKEINKKVRILSNKVDRVVRESFGDYLKALRTSKGYSLKALENKTQVTASYIHRLESGSRKTPSIPIAEKLAIGLGVPVKDFLAKLKIYDNDSDEIQNRITGLPEMIAFGNYTINGKKATKAQKDAMMDIISQILIASWTPDSKGNEQKNIIESIDKFKSIK